MGKLLLQSFAWILLGSLKAYACDDYLKSAANSPHFQRECDIQDRFQALRSFFKSQGININEISQYKALRFIDRKSWQRNLLTTQVPPDRIYEPAPATWLVWEEGINKILPLESNRGRLLKEDIFNVANFARMNRVLLTSEQFDVKDAKAGINKKSGEYRNVYDKSSGFCALADNDYAAIIEKTNRSLQAIQQRWETSTGMSFKTLVAKRGGGFTEKASFIPNMTALQYSCGPNLAHTFFKYTPGHEVQYQVQWLEIFLKETLKQYAQGRIVMPPLELSAFIQKWFVSIHPFGDGNGRTSRAVQDLISEHFDMPFVPGGDLQNDVQEEYDTYVQNTYQAVESMLSSLESCADQLHKGQPLTYECKTIAQHKEGR